MDGASQCHLLDASDWCDKFLASGLCKGFCEIHASKYYFGTDGSGGPFSACPRRRVCAWVVVAVERELPRNTVATSVAQLPGKCQTVPLAEAFVKSFFSVCGGVLSSATGPRRKTHLRLWIPLKSLCSSRTFSVACRGPEGVEVAWHFVANASADRVARQHGAILAKRARL